jgi:hypothetical protein
MDKISKADILKRLKKMTSVNVTKWAKKEGPSFGPMVEGSKGNRQDIEGAADFIKKLLEGEVMHYDGGREEVEFYPDFVVLEIHGQGQSALRRRYVIVKDSETEEYVSYLSWLW